MSFEIVISVYSLLLTLAAIVICLFQYVSKPRKLWVYAIFFFLATLLSNYYWCIYLLVMGDYPTVSSLMAYFGWNVAFLVLPFLLRFAWYEEEKGFFSPLCLIPIPLNVVQFIIYIQYGGIFNNIWQGTFATLAACISLNSIIYYLKNKKDGAKIPYIAIAGLIFIIAEYTMWTSSCFDWPSEWVNPYNYASIVDGFMYLMIPVAIIRTYGKLGYRSDDKTVTPLQKIFRPVCIIIISAYCIVGYAIAIWIRNTLSLSISQPEESDPFQIIAVMLFVVSVVIVSFSLMVVLVVTFQNKVAESALLKEEKESAVRSNAAKSDFLASMSHEIRTPLNAILGMNEMVMMESLKGRDYPPKEEKAVREAFSNICNYSGNIDSAGNNLLSIISDILDLSKIEAGKLEIIESEYQLSSVMNDVCNMVMFKAKAKDLQFNVDVEPDIPDGLEGDEVRIRQVIINVLNNSVKYTQKGSVSLTVREKRNRYNGDNKRLDLVVCVKDTGIGIKKEDIGKLFDKFERMDMKKNSSIEGTGLGLAITKRLLEMMDGDIEVESVYGKGSEFTITIPQRVVSEEPIGDFRESFEKAVSEMKVRKDTFHAPDAHILVVDDTKMNLTVVKGLLRSTQVQVDTADGGITAIELTSKNEYDIIFMDQRMPEMDGVTAMRTIKKKGGINVNKPFICLTADAISGARDRYIAEGFNDYLTKPIDSEALKNMVMKYLPPEKVIRGSDDVIKSDGKVSKNVVKYAVGKGTENVAGGMIGNIEDSAAGGNAERMDDRSGVNVSEYAAGNTDEDVLEFAAEDILEYPAGNDNDHDDGPEDRLSNAGRFEEESLVDIKMGLVYSGGDEEFYREILTDYIDAYNENLSAIEKYYAGNDWENYGTKAHALKSTSKSIGAAGLSEIALRMETAAEEGEIETIRKEHDDMLALYKKVVAYLKDKYLAGQ